MAEPWVSVDVVAAHIGVRKDSIYRWIEHRGLPAQKVGKLWKLKLSEVDAWMRARRASGEPAGSVQPFTSADRPRQDGASKPVVLVVDDDELVRDSFRDFLSDEGYRALLASDGAEAFELLASTSPRPSLIILDLGRPNMDGWQLGEQQSRDPNVASIPVIVGTADRSASVCGAVLLLKSVHLEQLATAIAQLLENK